MSGEAKRMLAERCASKVVDAIIEGTLIHSVCSESEDHNVVSIWSGGVNEQVGAIIADTVESAINAELAIWYRIYTHLRVVASQVGINHEAVRYDYPDDEIAGLTDSIITLNEAVQCSRSLANDSRSYEEAKHWHETDNGIGDDSTEKGARL